MNATIEQTPVDRPRQFPPFSLSRLLRTVFDPKPGERVCVLIDLEEPRQVEGFRFLQDPDLSIQRHAHDVVYQGLRNGVLYELGLKGGEMFAYEITGGSNLDLPTKGYATDGREIDLVEDVYKKYDLVLCVSTYSATAPLTAFAKQYGFRGATMHGMNQIILDSGLAVDYLEVSKEAEKLRQGMTRADWAEIDFAFEDRRFTLRIELAQQDAQKSHGLCRGGPDVANLPAGEIYYVPADASGEFPHKSVS
jgi:aminopeptidase